MEYLLVLKNGIGNKIFTLINFLHRYPKDTFYIVDRTTHHQEGTQEEKIWNLFPLLKEHPRIKFIRWKKYDELKETIKELEVPWKIFYEIDGFVPSIKKYFHASEDFNYLEEKLDFKKGIFVHVRLGDKVEGNIQALKKGNPVVYTVMKPEYYQDHISSLRKKDEPVYILSDSLEIAERMLPGYEYPDLNVNETFYCFQNARRVILSESSLSISAVLLSTKKKDLVVPNFLIMPTEEDQKKIKLVKSPYFSHGESNKNYIMTELKDFKKLGTI
jgi:hypothetical protein